MTRVFLTLCCALAVVSSSAVAAAQGGRDARLLITVVDQTGAIIPNAVVTAVRVDDPSKAVIGPVKTSDKGLATLEKLAAAVYTIEVEFPGFEKRIMKDLRLRAGDNKQVAILVIQGLQDCDHGRARQAGGGRGSEVHVRHRVDPGADRGALG